MIAYRTAKPEERDAYIELANYAFGFDAETLLPKVYERLNRCAPLLCGTESGRRWS